MKSTAKISAVTVAMFTLLVCVTFALFPPLAKANYCVYYSTLDEIPENVNIFRSIRTGTITHTKFASGNWYYRFFEEGYPEVYIKESAFMSAQPKNDYLVEDNRQLSQNCKNAAVKDEATGEWWSVKRVCYYRTTSLRDDTPYSENRTYVYTQSMYRLELNANASSNHHEIVVDAKLTSGVTFDYNARTSKLTRRATKLSLVPSVSLVVHEGPQVEKYKISGEAPQVTINDVIDAAGLIWSGVGCVKDIGGVLTTAGGMILLPKALLPAEATLLVAGTGKTMVECGFFLRELDGTFREADSRQIYQSDDIKTNRHDVAFLSPLKLKNSDNHVRAVYTLQNDYNSSTSFTIKFGFNSVE